MKSLESYLEDILSKNFNKDFVSYILTPQKAISFSLTVKTQGGIKRFKGYRIQHNNDAGIFKGGFRLHPSTNYETLSVLSFLMTIKTSLWDLPFGGAKGGINVDSKQLSDREKEQIVRNYIKKLKNDIGEDWDVLAPDIGTDSKAMFYIFDEYSILTNRRSFSITTGKPVFLKGLSFREKATGVGIAYLINKMMKLNKIPSPIKIGIFGFGNVGIHTAQKLIELGFKIYGVCDSKGGVISPTGLNINELIHLKRSGKSVIQYEKAKDIISTDEFLTYPFDLLILSAVENVINKSNVQNIKSKILVEGANAPIDLEVEDTLLNSGKIIIPDILANGGGVFTSYYEWIYGKTDKFFSEKDLEIKLKKKIDNLTELMFKQENLRKFLYKKALSKLHDIFIKKNL